MKSPVESKSRAFGDWPGDKPTHPSPAKQFLLPDQKF